ncbi:hypothetical protein LSAT2_019786 [Lamellibrachia satsuma]|nr:hypothetical protein LSAT2_019786 [Lamellibrachia satsuma]
MASMDTAKEDAQKKRKRVSLKQVFVCVLFVINVIFTLGGFAVIGGAAHLRRMSDKDLPNVLPENGHAVGSGPAFDEDEVTSFMSFWLNMMLLVGTLIVLISFNGVIGALTRTKWQLVMHIVILTHFAIFFLVLAISVATYALDSFLKGRIYASIESSYIGIYSFDTTSLALNYYMSRFHCCGLTNHKDFANADNWDSAPTVGGNKMTLKVPMACCMIVGNFPKATLSDATCPSSPSPKNSYMNTGCGGVLTKQIDIVRIKLIMFFCGLLIFLVSIRQ